MRASEFLSSASASLKSLVKLALLSRRSGVVAAPRHSPLVILANGPSLRGTIDTRLADLQRTDTLAVNFAANADEFSLLRPRYYVLADPHFFSGTAHDNVVSLWARLARADWEMTLFVPARFYAAARRLGGPRLEICRFNAVGVEGFRFLEKWAFSRGLGMPRPRNVLIPSVMIALGLGYREIYLAGADHSWLNTIRVDDLNHVVSAQPHFYKEDAKEELRVVEEYKGYRLHDILASFTIAFRSYHAIRRYADSCGARIYNATPGSFIDAFERRQIP